MFEVVPASICRALNLINKLLFSPVGFFPQPIRTVDSSTSNEFLSLLCRNKKVIYIFKVIFVVVRGDI